MTATAKVERIKEFTGSDLEDLCEATEKTIVNDMGFSIGLGWLEPPGRQKLESYWKGLLLVPERVLLAGRLDGVIAGSIQLIKPAPSNQTATFAATAKAHFVAPWARGHGLAKMLLAAAEEEARKLDYKILKFEVRATQNAAISLYESMGYKKWGVLDKYEFVHGQYVAGFFYYKDL